MRTPAGEDDTAVTEATDGPVFPGDFLIGAATAAHQIEGGNVNADLWDVERHPNTPFVEPSGDACDSYHRYEEDIELAAAAGLDAYRFGIEWARIEPEEGDFSRAALDHYRRMAAACLERGVTPLLTYQHFTVPKWFAREGGWRADQAADRFARYAERATRHLADLAPWVCTINEPNLSSMFRHLHFAPVGSGDQVDRAQPAEPPGDEAAPPPPRLSGFPSSRVDVMAKAHRAAVEAIKSTADHVQVGWTLALVDYQAGENGDEKCEAVRQATQLDWLDVSEDDDFVGVQTYSRELVGPDGRLPVPDDSETTQMGWEVYPQALEHTIRLAIERARRPVIVTENGIATSDDDQRIAYTSEALQGVRRCLDDGLDVRGYLHWSLLDNFEWMSGFSKTFGLIAVDRETFARHPKPSLAWLGQVARSRRP